MEGDYLGTAGGGGRGPRAMPFYLICDVSQPMRGELGALREGIARICQDIGGRPDINDVAHICIMTFADTADVLVELTQMSEAVVPGFRYARLTHYGAAFRMLATVIANDYETLSHLGYRVYRPCVYFLTAGEPTDLDWQRTFRETLTEGPMSAAGVPKGYPIFVPFGFRDAKEETLRQLAFPPGHSKWYHAQNNTFAEAIRGMFGIIMQSMLNSSSSLVAGRPAHNLPDSGDPWISAGLA